MNLVMQNSQILQRIFDMEYDGWKREGVISYALVCKAWSEPALNVLWHKLEAHNLPHAFRLLSPIKRITREFLSGIYLKGQFFGIAGDAGPRATTRKFAPIPTVLHYVREYSHPVNESLSKSLAFLRSHSPIFPNVQTLYIDPSVTDAAMFLHSSIRNLKIKLPASCSYHDFFRDVGLRAPDVASLSITINPPYWGGYNQGTGIFPITPCEDEVAQLLSGQKCLRELSLPRYWTTTKVIDALSCLDDLETISGNSWYGGHPLESAIFHPLLDFTNQDRGMPALPALQRLSLLTSYVAFNSFLTRWATYQPEFQTRLVELELESQTLECPATLKEVLQGIATCCPAMTTLSISSLHSPLSTSTSDAVPYDFDGQTARTIAPPPEGWTLKSLLPYRVNLATISPLFQLSQLRELELHHDLPAAFSRADLEIIATKFRRLTRLDLFSDPSPVFQSTNSNTQFEEVLLKLEDYTEKYVFDLRTPLRVFGTLCPELRSLSIFLCADSELTEEQSHSLDWSEPSTGSLPGAEWDTGVSLISPFPNLRSLKFGTSPILGSEETLALALGEYVGHDVEMSARGSLYLECRFDSYLDRLTRGGKVPDPIPDHTNRRNGYWKRTEIWKLDANGEPLGEDFAVVVGNNGASLSLGLDFVQPDEFGVKRLPGVFHLWPLNSVVSAELDARYEKWKEFSIGKVGIIRKIHVGCVELTGSRGGGVKGDGEICSNSPATPVGVSKRRWTTYLSERDTVTLEKNRKNVSRMRDLALSGLDLVNFEHNMLGMYFLEQNQYIS
ncbi:hypothetical protein BDN72DRAFT_914107 [Pluteus cervinus]|uniref:Uncharacterized protein n=1 Tax=Pluteus cervinus TaxID=181527 RepID=A0ACD2ZY76_9AGAR|nr:hypothetical protein BDN72DRAFT_914107 [Pluteus cervinus]